MRLPVHRLTDVGIAIWVFYHSLLVLLQFAFFKIALVAYARLLYCETASARHFVVIKLTLVDQALFLQPSLSLSQAFTEMTSIDCSVFHDQLTISMI